MSVDFCVLQVCYRSTKQWVASPLYFAEVGVRPPVLAGPSAFGILGEYMVYFIRAAHGIPE